MLFAVYFENDEGRPCMTAVFMMEADAQKFINTQVSCTSTAWVAE